MAPRYFALVPAAGYSTRMGEPKLLLRVAGQPLIWHTLAAWRASRVDRIVVVVRPDDHALASVVQGFLADARGDVVIPATPPPDMKDSLQAALKFIERQYAPTAENAFLVAPADMPRLSTAIINRLMERHATDAAASILAPTIAGRRGHPVLFRWPLAAEVFGLAANEGLNAVVKRHSVVQVPCEDLAAPDEQPFADVDTLEQYRQMTKDQ